MTRALELLAGLLSAQNASGRGLAPDALEHARALAALLQAAPAPVAPIAPRACSKRKAGPLTPAAALAAWKAAAPKGPIPPAWRSAVSQDAAALSPEAFAARMDARIAESRAWSERIATFEREQSEAFARGGARPDLAPTVADRWRTRCASESETHAAIVLAATAEVRASVEKERAEQERADRGASLAASRLTVR